MKIFALIAVLALASVPSVSEAGFVRNLLGRGKSAAGKVLRKVSHPFGGTCSGGSCR